MNVALHLWVPEVMALINTALTIMNKNTLVIKNQNIVIEFRNGQENSKQYCFQAESSRQMYRAVMEQVVRFLERAYKNLDLIKHKMDPKGSRDIRTPSPSRLV